MPLYEYQCESCQNRFEKIQKSYNDPPLETCPKCGKGPVRKLISSPAIQFKGTGWYITDYAKKPATDGQTGGNAGGDSAKSEKSDKSEKSEKTESKSDAKADSKSDSKSDSTSSSAAAAPKPSKTESS
jgi:putative FmdB family regulatory protein